MGANEFHTNPQPMRVISRIRSQFSVLALSGVAKGLNVMSTGREFGHEIELLRSIVGNLAIRPATAKGGLGAAGFAKAKIRSDGFVGILRPGLKPFTTLSEKLFSSSAKVERGVSFSAFQQQFLNALLSDYMGRNPEQISETDFLALGRRLADWFSKQTAKRTVFIPCVISPWPSPPFSVGPVNFVFLEDVTTSEYYQENELNFLQREGLNSLLEPMRKERAHWLAVAEVDNCDRERGQEIADLTVDLALVALQLTAPNMDTKKVSRLATRRGPGTKLTLSVSDGLTSEGFSNEEPGISMGDGYLAKIVHESAPLIGAVGNCIRSFATGNFRLPKLEQAWCDAAYWLHQGLAEPIDSIAVAKLETAIEVLLNAGSAKGSESRILAAMDTYYSRKPSDPIAPSSQVTTKEFAKGFVRDRSRVLHGTWSTLSVRLAGSRNSLESFAATLVRETAVELDLYFQSSSPVDDTETFLNWVKVRRQQANATPTN